MKQLLLLAILTAFISLPLCAQKKKHIKHHWNEAESLFDYGDYRSAINEYLPVIRSGKTTSPYYLKAILKTGICYFNLARLDSAWKYFSMINDSTVIEKYFYQAEILHRKNRLSDAEKLFRQYLSSFFPVNDSLKQQAERFLNQVSFAQKQYLNPQKIDIINLGAPVNTPYDEYVPLISADNQTLYFTARWPNTTGQKKDAFNRYFEDIYKSSNLNGAWSEPIQLDTTINSPLNDACAGLSPDEQKLFIFKTADDLISGDLYWAQMGVDNWEQPVKLPSSINSEYTESSATITVNDRIIYFSSDRPGGYGGKDLYKVTLLPDGSWSEAVNLGPMINTPYDEDAPFIHPSGKLYFSSKGHANNMGGFDVFVVEKDDEGNWLRPKNLGYPLNSVNDDIFFVLAADGKTGYYSSDKSGGKGGQDIYKIIFHQTKENLQVKHAIVRLNHRPEKAKITLINENSHLIEGEYFSNPNTGKFIFLIKPGYDYKLIIEYNNRKPDIVKLSQDDLLLQNHFEFNTLE